ncbi:unnamed protein product [Meganyctiphanes norvegica]|uniref:RRM domain-containing protein n=1 Tax=Meganyctiphanes norvegica TaxID=48144 RepID=A0AAV2RS62_MEGNR
MEKDSSKTQNTRVFLENLPKDIRKDEVDKTFSRYGKIAKVYLIYEPPGSGFVEYFDARDAEYAANQMDGADFMGSRVSAKVTRGGVPRGRGRGGYGGGGYGGGGSFSSRGGGGYNSRGRGGYQSYDGGYNSRGGGGYRGYSGGRGGYRGGSDRGGYGGRGFSRGRGYDRGGYSRGGGGYNSRGGGYSRGRGFSRGGGYRGGGSGGYSNSGSNNYESYSSDKYEKSYEKPSENGYSRYPSGDKYSSKYSGDKYSEEKYDKYVNYSGSRREEYHRSRSPVSHSPERYRSASPGYQRTRSRSPVSRGGRGGYGSRQYSSPSPPPPSREVIRSSRSRTRDYSPDRSYSHKEYSSSSYGGRRSPDARY